MVQPHLSVTSPRIRGISPIEPGIRTRYVRYSLRPQKPPKPVPGVLARRAEYRVYPIPASSVASPNQQPADMQDEGWPNLVLPAPQRAGSQPN